MGDLCAVELTTVLEECRILKRSDLKARLTRIRSMYSGDFTWPQAYEKLCSACEHILRAARSDDEEYKRLARIARRDISDVQRLLVSPGF